MQATFHYKEHLVPRIRTGISPKRRLTVFWKAARLENPSLSSADPESAIDVLEGQGVLKAPKMKLRELWQELLKMPICLASRVM